MNLQQVIEQCTEDTGFFFPEKKFDLPFQTLCMVGEVGEFANLVKKVERGTDKLLELLPKMEEELADVLIYLCIIASILEIDLEKAYHDKRAYNTRRFESRDV